MTVSCVGGSEKSQFMADPEVVRLLKEKHGLTVQWQAMGPTTRCWSRPSRSAAGGWNCLWPSSASAQQVFEAKHAGQFPPAYRAETVLQSPPEVIYAGPNGTDACCGRDWSNSATAPTTWSTCTAC